MDEYYLTVSKGSRADLAEPVLAVCDPEIVAELFKVIGRLGSGERRGTVTKLVRDAAAGASHGSATT